MRRANTWLATTDAADRLVAAIEAAAERLAAFPSSGRSFGADRRAAQVARTPFRLIYRVGQDSLDIVAL
ncbi:MAG TPA: type II toxin-antitoxin system RelE/ParE family toxin [Crenalkalicoccus sp.]|jgi:plasmid stabilization system protein ParE|nr:type II toxin-antitoxin system RelE/ParE family toxin [Crenalkalicoccus sp.]